MSKNTRGVKEFTREQKLINENRTLKRQVASLRKELARVDLDRYSNLKETIEKHYQEDRAQEGKDILERLKQEWRCHKSNCSGYLEITLFNKINEVYYYRRCTECLNRTKSQKYTPEVKGIVKKSNQ